MAALLSPALHNISLMADVRALVLSLDVGWSFLNKNKIDEPLTPQLAPVSSLITLHDNCLQTFFFPYIQYTLAEEH